MRGIRRLLVALMVVGMLVSGVVAAFADAGGRPNENGAGAFGRRLKAAVATGL
jgi:hypothetical protein